MVPEVDEECEEDEYEGEVESPSTLSVEEPFDESSLHEALAGLRRQASASASMLASEGGKEVEGLGAVSIFGYSI